MNTRISRHESVSHAAGASGPELVVAKRPRIRDRVAAWSRPRRLDFALAAGAPAEASAALALRARWLTKLSRRRSIADALRRVVREARDGAAFSAIRIIPSRARVATASEELTALADILADPRPVTAHGVAQAWILLTDGTGPLYNSSSSGSLRERAAAAAEALRLQNA